MVAPHDNRAKRDDRSGEADRDGFTMAQIVLGIGAPHSPMFPATSKALGDRTRITTLFAELRHRFEAAKPDLIVIFTSDHFVGFFYDNMPIFCVGSYEKAEGPWEISASIPKRRISGAPKFAAGLIDYGVDQCFDLSSSQELKVDHSVFVPLHFIVPDMNVPVVTINIRGHQLPLPRADRCHALGQMVRRYIEQWPGAERIALIASGNLSLEVGGPRMGEIDREWWELVVDRVRNGNIADLVKRATTARMQAAGNTAGELLNWIALLGALNDRPPDFLEPDAQPPDSPRDAHAYAAWEARHGSL
jgi:aromatic ring-opening dioxygenase catalytic subunit (LigB family)